MDATAWIVTPLVGALIGWGTNTIAVLMLFRPHRPRRLGLLTLHGLIPKRQPDLARKIGDVVGTHLVGHEDLVRAFHAVDLRPMVAGMLDQAMAKRLGDLASLPLVGAFLTPERLRGIRDGLVEAIVEQRDAMFEHVEKAIEEHLDVAEIVRRKVAEFSTRHMEALVLGVARRELRAIEVWGGVLGALVGLAQVAVLAVLR
jgi:uncharacterized membrane protein YheB (UPF0754 family)